MKEYYQEFCFPDILGQSYPVYAVSEKGRLVNFKALVYPSPTSCKKFTRNKQLKRRSAQAKIFDAIINIGYFDPLLVHREFPILIENSKRLPGMRGGLFWLLDFYFPELKLAVELDSDLHDKGKDSLRDKYLKVNLGIDVFRLSGLQRESVQKREFRELVKEMRGRTIIKNPQPFIFTTDLYQKLQSKSP